ncbi:GTP pyrophosphokinase [Chryseobacterium lathyri]|uniref:PpGpp synthetase/RelA/SpoT-type nucleotidyltransferase n=1 Tax=Chryseobacterium lathyri TaxID=395933 RepID=A0ABT9SQN6_9FLAO|nr:hypothetical protein [Chryseobacterium lathyri]MDP9961754.1 ppGpp synthetase/RelA/SpoT-type nucleotidyltransferase [Chryseobacterium lathyri]
MDRNKIKLEISKHKLFTNNLKNLIESLLQVNDIKYHIIECRTKSIDSLIDKIDRKQINEINEITDLSGIRIITYYQDDIDAIEKIILDNFKIDEPNSINKSNLYKSNEFGYLSVHYIVSLNRQRQKLAEWKNFATLKAEIQVRTVLQHSWASISHELSYKKKYEIPKQLERKLYRLAGLFELADEQFLNIREEHKNLFNEFKNNDFNNKIEDEKINLFTLNYLFSEEEKLDIFNFIENKAIEAGFLVDYEEFEETKSKNYLSELIKISKILEIKTINDFHNALIKNKDFYSKYFQLLIENNEGPWFGDSQFFISLALMLELNSKQLKQFQDEGKWSKSILEIIEKAIDKLKKISVIS